MKRGAGARPPKKRKLAEPQRQAVVLDIEGTVTPLSFVKDKLFPYAAQHMEAFLEANHGRPEVHASLQSLHAAVRSRGQSTAPGTDVGGAARAVACGFEHGLLPCLCWLPGHRVPMWL